MVSLEPQPPDRAAVLGHGDDLTSDPDGFRVVH